jgi:hypothetical protein
MADREDQVLRQQFDIMESSSDDYDLVVNDDGVAVYTNMASGQQTLESEAMNPFAVSGMPEERESYGEFTETIASGTTGAVGGATAVTAGLPGDLFGLGQGIADAVSAEEGEQFASFLERFAEVSNEIGSGKTLEIFKEQVDRLPVSDEAKSDILEGSRLLGEWAELPLGLKAIASGIRKYAAGASARVADRAQGTTLSSGIDPTAPVDSAIVGAQRMMGRGNQAAPKEGIVSSRLPTAKAAQEDPMESRLQIGLDSARADEKSFNKNAQVIQAYPNVRYKGDNPEKATEDLVEHVKDNLLYLHDSVPEATRQRSKQWYEGARSIVEEASSEYGVPDQAAAGVMAVLSPQKDWFMNASLGQRVIDIHTSKANEPWTDEMMTTATRIFGQEKYQPIVNDIANKTYAELDSPAKKAMWLRIYDETNNPREHYVLSPEGERLGVRETASGEPYKTGWGSLSEIGKAITILENPDRATISSMLGDQHKVRSFYNNIYSPMDDAGDVTIDTHAVAAGLLRPLSGGSTEVTHNFGGTGIANSSKTGAKGTYGIYADAYRKAAEERGLLPREMQSITWEAVRGLFNPRYKGQGKNVQYVDNVWNKYKKGEITLDQARDEVIQHAGGIEPPEWQRSGAGSAERVQNSSQSGELPRSSVSGQKRRPARRRRNSSNTRKDSSEDVTSRSPNPKGEGDL